MLGFLSAACIGLVVDRTAKAATAVTKDKPQGNISRLNLTLMIMGGLFSGDLRPGENLRTALGYCYCTLGQQRVFVTDSID
jgi:hypothetical protein